MRKELFIIGAGSVGGHIAWNMNSYSKDYKIAGFFDDDSDKIGQDIFGLEVLGPVDDLLNLKDVSIVMGIAFPTVKKKVVEQLAKNDTLHYPTLIHNRAWVSKGVSIGKGSIVYPGTSINYGSKIGNFVVINMNCAFGHHTQLGDYSSFAPGVSTGGHTIIGSCVDVGIGVSTIQNIKIGDGSIVGGNSIVIQDVSSNSKIAGVPAKEL